MGVTVATVRTTCNTATGNQDITTSDLGGLTPKAALFIVTYCTSDGTAADHAVLSYGAATGSSNRWVAAASCEHNQGTTDAYRRATEDECVMILDPTDGSIDGEADFNSWITNGVRITWGNAPSAAFLMTVVLFAGSDLSAQADVFRLGNEDVETHVNTVGFEPALLFTASDNAWFNDFAAAHAAFSAGIVHNGASVSQHCYGFLGWDNLGTSAAEGRITSTYGIIQAHNGGLNYGGDFGGFDADGFSCWPRGGNANDDVGFLALNFNGAVDCWAGIEDSPSATGDWSVTSPGFQPQFVMMGLTMMAALDTQYSDASAGSIGFSTFDEDDACCNSVQDEDNQGTSDTQSLSNDQAIDFPQDDGSAGYTATFSSFDANGWTLNFSAEVGSDKWWGVAIKKERVPRYPAVVVQNPAIY